MKKICSLIVVLVTLTVLASCGDGRHSRLQNLYGANAGANADASTAVSGLQCVDVGNVSTLKAKAAVKMAVATESNQVIIFPACFYTGTCPDNNSGTEQPTTGGVPSDQPASGDMPNTPAVESKKECVKAALARMSLIGYWKEGKYFYSVDATMRVPGPNAITTIKFESCDQVETANCLLTY